MEPQEQSKQMFSKLADNLSSESPDTREKSLIALNTLTIPVEAVTAYGPEKFANKLVSLLSDPILDLRYSALTATKYCFPLWRNNEKYSHWTYILETHEVPFGHTLLQADFFHKLHALIYNSAKEMIDNTGSLFAGELMKHELLVTTAFVSAGLICELSDKELAETKVLGTDGEIVKLSAELIATGKITIPLFKKVVSFLYISSKMSEKVASYLREKDEELLKKMMSSLVGKEMGDDLELLSGVAGLVYSVLEDLNKVDKAVGTEIVRVLHKIIVETKPAEEYQANIDTLIKAIDEEKEEEKVENLRKDLDQAASNWVNKANANSIALEVFAELFTSEETPEPEMEEEEDFSEDVKMEETEELPYVETIADSLLDQTFVNSVISKCTQWLTSENYAQLKSLREASEVYQAVEKLRTNAFGCLLNFMLNRSKKAPSLLGSDFKNLVLQSLKEVVKNPNKHAYMMERISTFLKVACEKMAPMLQLEKLIAPADIPAILVGIQEANHEIVQGNLISVLGIILKSVPHPADLNKECCKVLLGLAMKGSLGITTAVLNALFDIYSEEDHNSVLKELGVLKILNENVENYKALITSNKEKVDRSEYEYSKTTLLNLKRFVQYKKKYIG